MSVKVTVSGLDELKRTLADLPRKIQRNIMRSAVRAGATVIADEARRLVPVRFGQLKHSIRIKAGLTKTGAIATVSVGSRDKVFRKGRPTKSPYKRLTAEGAVQYSAAYYAHFVEFGTKPHAIKAKRAKALTVPGSFARAPFRKSVMHPGAKANPFMRTAASSKAQAALQAAVDYAIERINGLNGGGK
jgi:HK97 gp10 family phage protein